MLRRYHIIGIAALVAAALLATYTVLSTLERGPTYPLGEVKVGGPFSLTDQAGKRVSDADFAGRYMLVVFGYTYCPDLCPAELQVISAALDKLGAGADSITPVFITIDPERDTPAVLAQYMPHFRPGFVGLTGSAEEIAAVAKQYRVYYAKQKSASSNEVDYLMDHSTIIYLMGPDGKFVKYFTYTTDVAGLAEDLRTAIGG